LSLGKRVASEQRCYDACMTAARLKEQMRLVGEAKAESHREMAEAHLALPLGERLERAVRLSDTMLKLWRDAGRPGEQQSLAESDEAWRRVYETLQRTARRG
jgi:hypothetical protein